MYESLSLSDIAEALIRIVQKLTDVYLAMLGKR